jgi:hypothetical protein
MEKVNITIPDNLTHEQEIFAIAKALGAKMLPSGKTKLLGSGYEIQNIQTQITITREAVEKPIVTIECSVCKTIFEKKIGAALYVNYGGKPRKRLFCSTECCNEVINICGEGRAALNKKDLKPFRILF